MLEVSIHMKYVITGLYDAYSESKYFKKCKLSRIETNNRRNNTFLCSTCPVVRPVVLPKDLKQEAQE